MLGNYLQQTTFSDAFFSSLNVHVKLYVSIGLPIILVWTFNYNPYFLCTRIFLQLAILKVAESDHRTPWIQFKAMAFIASLTPENINFCCFIFL